ncbi:MAG: quercetin 2,3-dioxygenase [Pseudonocardiales bacterium]
MTIKRAVVREHDEGERRWFFGGGLQTWLATEADTDGEFLIFEDYLEGGKTTPLHHHPHTDETFIMLDGEIKLRINDDDRKLGAGGIAVIPRGVPHAFIVTSPTARMLCLHTPGNSEAFFKGASEPTTQDGPSGPVDFARVGRSAHETGAIEILGPPPF